MVRDRLAPGRDDDENEARPPLISAGERQALRWMALAVVLFFVVFIVGFVAANS